MRQIVVYIILIVLLGFFNACTSDKVKNIPDVSNIIAPVNIIRFDQLLFDIDTNNIVESLQELEGIAPVFTNLYLSKVVPVKAPNVPELVFYEQLSGFLTDARIKKLQDTTSIVFSDFEGIATDFEQAFKFYKYYFPDKVIPDIYTFISEYTYGSFIFPDKEGKDGIGVGLDMFLGADYPYRSLNPQNPVFSDYNTRSFNRAHLVKKAMDAVVDDLIGDPQGNRLIDLMVHNGKALYLLDQFLPYTVDSIKLEYTQKQVDWVNNPNNERQMWALFLGEELLYATQRKRIQKLINPAPTSPGMPPESPGRTGNYMGWQIVKAYMEKYPETSLEELIAMKDAQIILDQSKYKPPR